jgi:hypothetical protein
MTTATLPALDDLEALAGQEPGPEYVLAYIPPYQFTRMPGGPPRRDLWGAVHRRRMGGRRAPCHAPAAPGGHRPP